MVTGDLLKMIFEPNEWFYKLIYVGFLIFVVLKANKMWSQWQETQTQRDNEIVLLSMQTRAMIAAMMTIHGDKFKEIYQQNFQELKDESDIVFSEKNRRAL